MLNDYVKMMEGNHDEEMIKLAKDLHQYAVNGLVDLRNAYPKRRPKELLPHEEFFRDMISTTAVFLAETGHWYTNTEDAKTD